MRRLALFLGRMSPKRRVLLQAGIGAVVTYYAALLSAQIASIFELKNAWVLLFHAVISVLLLIVLAVVLSSISDAIELFIEKRRLVVATANTQLARCTIAETQRLLELEADQLQARPLVRHDPASAIKRIVEACYSTLEAHYGEAEVPGQRTSFEATFMTRDASDHEVTVSAWANRQGRMPDSLRARLHNPKVYERSVTADIYRSVSSERAAARIIEDTSKEPYEELYAGQKDRIKSSIVYPIMSTASELLGTLVVHCDEVAFFSRADSKYWLEFLDLFAARIALEKLRLDLATEGPLGNVLLAGPAVPGTEKEPDETTKSP